MQPAVVPAEYLFLLVRFGCVLSCRQKLLIMVVLRIS